MNAILKPVPQATFVQLKDAWSEQKALEKEANEKRLAIEKQILDLVECKPEGSNKFDNLTITTGFSRDWDQEALSLMSAEILPEYFPFKTEFKEDRKGSKFVEERFPELWDKIKTALTTKPKKPSFAIKE